LKYLRSKLLEVQNMLKKQWIVSGLCVVMAFSSLSVFARDHDHDRGHDRDGGRGEHYHYRDGHWYHRGWFGFDFLAPALAFGAIVDALPYGYTTVVVGGVPYYRCDGIYYRHYPEGYVVMEEPSPVLVVQEQNPMPVSVAAPQESGSESVIINVPNAQGGYTPVKLIKHKGGYLGPQGEYYEHPAVSQLKALYGK